MGKKNLITLMRMRALPFLFLAAFAGLGTATQAGSAAGTPLQTNPSLNEHTVSCQVMETWEVQTLGVSLAIFHQASSADAAELGMLLRSRDGAEVQFQTPDGAWHQARVLRLKVCFGRGMLVFRVGTAVLVKREVIGVRFPIHTGSLR
jgi:hypothetical protein